MQARVGGLLLVGAPLDEGPRDQIDLELPGDPLPLVFLCLPHPGGQLLLMLGPLSLQAFPLPNIMCDG